MLKYDYSQLKFLNYGYESLNPESKRFELEEDDETERYCIQLYNHTVGSVNLKGKDILEVGCGRGGGASFLTRYYKPNSFIGLDLSKKLIRFCIKNCCLPGLSFVYGNAEDLPFDDNSFDAIVNIESSRDYCNVDIFLNEAYRVLRSKGFLLLSDLRTIEGRDLLIKQIKESGFEIVEEEDITENTLKALDLDYERRYNLAVGNRSSRFLERVAVEWSGLRGSERYELFVEGSLVYLRYKLKKSE